MKKFIFLSAITFCIFCLSACKKESLTPDSSASVQKKDSIVVKNLDKQQAAYDDDDQIDEDKTGN